MMRIWCVCVVIGYKEWTADKEPKINREKCIIKLCDYFCYFFLLGTGQVYTDVGNELRKFIVII